MKAILKIFRKLYRLILDLLLPVECLGCGKEGQWLCDKCLASIFISHKFQCPSCGKETPLGKTCKKCESGYPLDGLIHAAKYNNKLLQKCINVFKYQGVRDMAVSLGELIGETLRRLPAQGLDELAAFTLIPVPLHRKKLLDRGFNQSELLARRLAGNLGLPIDTQILYRKKNTRPQAKKKSAKRKKNLEGAFACRAKPPEKVLLIDDVFTSGSTMAEAARTLKAAGAKKVRGLVLARG